MPQIITNPEDEEITTIPTIAESWRVPTEAIQGAVDEAIGQLPPVNDATLTIKQNGTTKGTFTANDADDTTIELQDTTYTNFTGTDGTSAGSTGLVPAPAATDADKFLKSDGTWAEGGASAVLYDGTGQNTDGSMTQKATTDALGGKQDTLTAGTNITIDANNEISATDTTYTAGTGLSLAGTEFSANTTVLATQTDLSNGLATKQNTLTAGSNIQINNDTISATDTTYSDFTGTDGTTAGTAGLVPAPATTDADKFLKADGTWAEAGGGGGPEIVQVTGNSTTAVMSQAATTNMIYPSGEETQKRRISIGSGANAPSGWSIAIGESAHANGYRGLAIGQSAGAPDGSVAIGANAGSGTGTSTSERNSVYIGRGAASDSSSTIKNDSVALGSWTKLTRDAEVSVGGNYPVSTRYIANVTDPQLAQDAATKNYVDSIYPVGAVFTSTSATAPTIAGGTWAEIGTQTVGSSTVHYYERTA